MFHKHSLHKRLRIAYTLPVAGMLLLAACQPLQTNRTGAATGGNTAKPAAIAQMTDSISVSDQTIKNGEVTIAKVVSQGPAWIDIYTDNNGKVGDVIGHAAIKNGENANVLVQIDQTKATPTLFAMLHSDLGKVGTYEFPGADVPVMVNGKDVQSSFKLSGLTAQPAKPAAVAQPAQPAAQPAEMMVMLHKDAKFGDILTDAKGMTLYLFTKDTANMSTCSGDCLTKWPAFTLKDATMKIMGDKGLTGAFASFKRDDGTFQVTYDGHPLYYYYEDKAPGDVNGQGVGEVWFALHADGKAAS
ncbi:MAG: hypothetical protein R2911_01225 [Caldilineaceae bacterium]